MFVKKTVAGCQLPGAGCRLLVCSSYRFQVTGYRLQVTGCRLQFVYPLTVTSVQVQDSVFKLQIVTRYLLRLGSQR